MLSLNVEPPGGIRFEGRGAPPPLLLAAALVAGLAVASSLDELSLLEALRDASELSFDEAFEQYRAFSYQTLMVGVVPLGLSSLTERSETVLAVTKRGAAAVERLGLREWIEGL